MAEDEGFPLFALETNYNAQVDSEYVDELYEFLTTPVEARLDERFASQCPVFAPNKIGIELHFASRTCTPECLGLVQVMLDRVYASPTRQFAIRTLDLGHEMSASYTERAAEIIRRNHQIYNIECVRLDRGLTSSVSTKEVKASGKLMAAAFDVTPEQQSGLRSFHFGTETFHVQTVAAFCSALRYGCQVESIKLMCNYDKLDDADRKACWKWLAFGVFYPRFKKLAVGNKFRVFWLGQNHLAPEDIHAFKRTLLDPAGELACQGGADHTHAKNELLICKFKQGARFYGTAAVGSKEIYQLDRERELEVMCQYNSWACAVLPGIGLGWVRARETISTEREVIDRDSVNCDRLEWTSPLTSRSRSSLAALLLFLELVGSQLTRLNVAGVPMNRDPRVLPAILEFCVNLQHLDLNRTRLDD